MKNEKIVNYKEIGEVLYRKNARARNISIRINSKGSVRVTVPGWCTYHRAEEFVVQKKDWIITKSHKIKSKTKENLVWNAGQSISFHGGMIFLEQGKGEDFQKMQRDNDYIVELPILYNPGQEEWTEKLMGFIAAIGLEEAKLLLPEMLANCAEKSGYDYNKVSVRRMKTRWGSCSSVNNISLNSALIFLPEKLINYVMMHELAHTKQKNHSRYFWDELMKHYPDALVHRKLLHKHAIIA